MIGIATVWITIYPLIFIGVWFLMMSGMILSAGQSSDSVPPFFVVPFFLIFPLHLITILLIFGLEAFYLAHIILNKTASDVVRIILGVGSFFMPFVAMPVYYFVCIWPDEPPEWARGKPA